MKKQAPERPFNGNDWHERDFRLLKDGCYRLLTELESEGRDVSKIRMWVERIEILHATEFERRCYLEGYSEHLFTELVSRDSK